MNSVSTITLPTSNDNNNKQANSNTNNSLLLSTSVALVKTQLYQCWLQVYGPIFWIVSAMIGLYNSNNSNTTSTTSTPRPPLVRHYSYYRHNHHHQVNLLQVKRGQQNTRCDNKGDDYYDEGKNDDSNIIDNRVSPSSTLRVRHDQQVENPKLEVSTAPQSKKSLRRSFKLHMQSFKGSFNQVVRRSTTRFQRNKQHSNNDSNNINSYYHYDNNTNNNDNINDESIVIHPLDFGLQSTCSSTSTAASMTRAKEGRERRRESFVSTVTKSKNNPIFNPFRRKTAPE